MSVIVSLKWTVITFYWLYLQYFKHSVKLE